MNKIMTLLLVILTIAVLTSGCNDQEVSRMQKDQESAENGLNRVLTVYDQNGKAIKEYEGKFDIEWGDGGKVKFDINNKRTIIYNAIVICQEK